MCQGTCTSDMPRSALLSQSLASTGSCPRLVLRSVRIASTADGYTIQTSQQLLSIVEQFWNGFLSKRKLRTLVSGHSLEKLVRPKGVEEHFRLWSNWTCNGQPVRSWLWGMQVAWRDVKLHARACYSALFGLQRCRILLHPVHSCCQSQHRFYELYHIPALSL